MKSGIAEAEIKAITNPCKVKSWEEIERMLIPETSDHPVPSQVMERPTELRTVEEHASLVFTPSVEDNEKLQRWSRKAGAR